MISATVATERCAPCGGWGWVRPGGPGSWREPGVDADSPIRPRYPDAYPIEYAIPRAQGARICPHCGGKGVR